MLRCIRPIEVGDEIVRLMSTEKSMEFLEKVDRVVVSPKREVGRITLYGHVSSKGFISVEFPGGRTELVARNTGFALAYKHQTN